jgi:hypothetical protein
MYFLITIFGISLVAIIGMLVAKSYRLDEKSIRYLRVRRDADTVIGGLSYILKKEWQHFLAGCDHFFKKGAPLFIAHSSSIVATVVLKKSSRIVDMVKGRDVLDHSGAVSPFLDQVSEYKDKKVVE